MPNIIRRIIPGAIPVIVAAFVAPAAAQIQVCGDHEKMTSYLERQYNELRQNIATSASGALIEIYTSKAGTFTILRTTRLLGTCILSAGDGWQDLERKPKDKDS